MKAACSVFISLILSLLEPLLQDSQKSCYLSLAVASCKRPSPSGERASLASLVGRGFLACVRNGRRCSRVCGAPRRFWKLCSNFIPVTTISVGVDQRCISSTQPSLSPGIEPEKLQVCLGPRMLMSPQEFPLFGVDLLGAQGCPVMVTPVSQYTYTPGRSLIQNGQHRK